MLQPFQEVVHFVKIYMFSTNLSNSAHTNRSLIYLRSFWTAPKDDWLWNHWAMPSYVLTIGTDLWNDPTAQTREIGDDNSGCWGRMAGPDVASGGVRYIIRIHITNFSGPHLDLKISGCCWQRYEKSPAGDWTKIEVRLSKNFYPAGSQVPPSPHRRRRQADRLGSQFCLLLSQQQFNF